MAELTTTHSPCVDAPFIRWEVVRRSRPAGLPFAETETGRVGIDIGSGAAGWCSGSRGEPLSASGRYLVCRSYCGALWRVVWEWRLGSSPFSRSPWQGRGAGCEGWDVWASGAEPGCWSEEWGVGTMPGELLGQALPALAAAGGAAVVQAAGTDVWTALRARVARLFGRGDAARESAELERLDRTHDALAPGASQDDVVRVRMVQEGVWQARFETLLEELDDSDRKRVAGEVQALIALAATATGGVLAAGTGKATARDGGTATTGIHQTGGSGGTGPAVAVNTGDAEATGTGSAATTGIVRS